MKSYLFAVHLREWMFPPNGGLTAGNLKKEFPTEAWVGWEDLVGVTGVRVATGS